MSENKNYRITARAKQEFYSMAYSLNTMKRIIDGKNFAVMASENGTVWFLDGDEKKVLDNITIYKPDGFIEFSNPIEAYADEIRIMIDTMEEENEKRLTREKEAYSLPWKTYKFKSGLGDFKVHNKGFAIITDNLGHDFDLTLEQAESIVNILELSKMLKEHEKPNKNVSI